MSDKENVEQGAVEFLIAEYNEISQETRRLRQEGITRLNFFITITSSILAVLAFVSQNKTMAGIIFQFVASGVLLLLLFIGLDTFKFTIRRDINTDLNIRAVARIRRFFAIQNPKIQQYLTWQYHDEPTPWVTDNTSNVRLTAQYILSFICALMAGLLFNLIGVKLTVSIVIGVVVLVASFLIFQDYATRQFKRASIEAKQSMKFPVEISGGGL